MIVDQHFLQRQRGNRLISGVLDHPTLVGVGIDEATAVIFQGTMMTVLGKSGVVVVDPVRRRERSSPAARWWRRRAFACRCCARE